jgi:hypothetical protein
VVAGPEGLIAVSERSADEKIELLVRSVLEAVDARLAEVRHEMHELGADVDRRHQEVLQRVEDIERKLERRSVEAVGPAAGTDGLALRMEQATQVLLERIEAMHQRNTMATNERFALLDAAVEQLSNSRTADTSIASDPTDSAAVSSTPTSTVPSTHTMPRLDAMNAPFRMDSITTEQPVMAAPPALQHAAVDTAPVAAVAAVAEDHIDIDQLADLLTERLAQMSLPPRPL